MRAIIISAGQGTRLLPLTMKIPKCLVEVHGRTILDHQILALHAAGIREVILVGGYKVGQIREHLARSSPPLNVRLLINPFWSVASSIGSVWAARDFLHEPFCLLNGDTIFDATVIQDALRRMQPGVNLLVEATDSPELDDMRVQVRQGRIAAVSKELPREQTTHRSMGMVMCRDDHGAYRQALQDVIEDTNGHDAFHHAVINHLAHTLTVAAIASTQGQWREIDRVEDIERWVRDHGATATRAPS